LRFAIVSVEHGILDKNLPDFSLDNLEDSEQINPNKSCETAPPEECPVNIMLTGSVRVETKAVSRSIRDDSMFLATLRKPR
jgi:hypothetical protein